MFEIGKEVVALKTHPWNLYKEGDIFTILSIKNSNCSCNVLLLDIGIKGYSTTMCYRCGVPHGGMYFMSKDFKPLDEIDITEVTEILKEQTQQV